MTLIFDINSYADSPTMEMNAQFHNYWILLFIFCIDIISRPQ